VPWFPSQLALSSLPPLYRPGVATRVRTLVGCLGLVLAGGEQERAREPVEAQGRPA